jgi:filamentous hemagglutinin family protein
MNKHCHRLVFSRRLGTFVAVSELTSPRGKQTQTKRAVAAAAAAALSMWAAPATAQTNAQPGTQPRPPVAFASQRPVPANLLPQPSTTRTFVYNPAQGSGTDLHATGRVTWTKEADGKTATFNQGTVDRVVVNWDSFDIGAGNTVRFVQNPDPTRHVSALNRIWSADPSVILGSLQANREVILLNANGVYFGRGARVDTGKFIATANSIADAVFDKGLRNVTDGSAVFSTTGSPLSDVAGSGVVTDTYQNTNLDAAVTVEPGAQIRVAAGGDVLLIAPRVVNQGRVETPKGQTILAAGDKVYLMSSSDPAQRGLIVAVDPVKLSGTSTNDTTVGTAENAATGSFQTDGTAGVETKLNEIRAESGTVNLVGLLVRQSGKINATTAVKGANGAIYLQAMASTTALAGGVGLTDATKRGLQVEEGGRARAGLDLGTVELTAGSQTHVLPASDSATQIDAEQFNPSRIRVEGASILVRDGASVQAPAGRIELLAATNTVQKPGFDSSVNNVPIGQDGSRIVVESGASISAAGLRDVAVDGQRNQGQQRLFRIELADAPVQRSGPLYRSEVFFDLRDAGKITVANVSGALNAVARTAGERSSSGGSISLLSEGGLVVGSGALLDVSGGSVRYSEATLQRSLLSRGGRLFELSTASPDVAYDGLAKATQKLQVPSYLEGKDGGTLTLSAWRGAVAGQLLGSVAEGLYQRDGRATRAAPAALVVGRELTSRFYLQGLQLGQVEPQVPLSFQADPLGAPLADLPTTLELSVPGVRNGGFGSLRLRAANVTSSAPTALDLGVAGSFDLLAGAANLDIALTLPGGTATLATLTATDPGGAQTSGDLSLAAGARIDASGVWTNDLSPTHEIGDRVATSGGDISLRAARSLTLGHDARLDVSAGARLTSTSTGLGRAGSIRLAAGSAVGKSNFTVDVGSATLAGYDFGSGGSLSLEAPALTVSETPGTGFSLTPSFFATGGFGRIAVSSTTGITVTAGTQLAPRLLNWQFAPGFRAATSGAMAERVAAVAAVDERVAERQPVNLALAANGGVDGVGDLTVERGAGISLEHGGALSLRATGSLLVGASGGAEAATTTLSARGGSILLAVDGQRGGADNTPNNDGIGFRAGQALWLGSGSLLTVDGVAALRPEAPGAGGFGDPNGGNDSSQRQIGSVLGGGTITLQASRGYVVAAPGSQVRLDGIAQAINIAGLRSPVMLARAAGTLSVSSPEGFALEGTISAHAPTDPSTGRALADGGRLLLSLGTPFVSSATVSVPYPDSNGVLKPRTLAIGDFAALVGSDGSRPAARPGDDLNARLDNGIGRVPLSGLASWGFDSLSLAAGDQVRFDADARLNMKLGIDIQAPIITAKPGVQVALAGSHVALGDIGNRLNTPDITATADTSAARDTAFRVTSPEIDLYNSFGLSGFSTITLDAGSRRDGEVRFNSDSSFGATSQLNFAGQLKITAGQAYATSGTKYLLAGLPVAADGDAGSELIVRAPEGGSASTAPLSAFGQLTVQATRIDQGGVLRQPFGSITLDATQRLTLGNGSLTSVSADGSTVPLGKTDNLTDWVVAGQSRTQLPLAKSIQLTANEIQTAPGATVSAGGGGDVAAWEFFAGVGGSKDYYETSGVYAILPGYAPTRALAFGGGASTGTAGGRQLVLTMAAGGLAAGRYTLLPARYAAMVPGAVLVSRARDQGRTVLQAPIARDDGSVLVTGYLSEANSATVGAPGERFVLEPAATYRAKTDLRISSVSALLAGATPSAVSTAVPRDAGLVSVRLGGSGGGALSAQLDLAANGGAAGLLDISAPGIALVGALDQAPAGTLAVAVDTLNGSGARSILLGGTRQQDATSLTSGVDAWTVDAASTDNVLIDPGTSKVAVRELLVAAAGSVSVAAGADLRALDKVADTGTQVALSGDGAFLAVSARPVAVRRSNATRLTGTLDIGSDARLEGAQVAFDATAALTLQDGAQLAGGALTIAAPRLVIGTDADTSTPATVLAGAMLDNVKRFNDLLLRSYTRIDFMGRQNWAERPAVAGAEPVPGRVFDRLVLDSPALRTLAATGSEGATDIAAARLTLQNTVGGASPAATEGSGSLRLQAVGTAATPTPVVTLGPGKVALNTGDARIDTPRDIVLLGNGALTAQNQLTMTSARLTAATGADASIAAGGALQLTAATDGVLSPEAVGRGAALKLSAQQVSLGGRIELSSGRLRIDGSGGDGQSPAVRFESGSQTLVGGAVQTGSDGSQVVARGGDVTVNATAGSISVAGTIDVSAAQLADATRRGGAGSLSFNATGTGGGLQIGQATAGQPAVLKAQGGVGEAGGALSLDVRSAPDLVPVLSQAAAGGFDRELSVRVREGSVALDSAIKAQRVSVSADGGQLALSAAIDARGATGGVVRLAAAGDVTLGSGASIDARSSRSGAGGGDVLLGSSAGTIRIDPHASIDAGGDDASDGRIVLRAARVGNSGVKVDPLDAARLLAGDVTVEAVRAYSTVTASGVTRDIARIATGTSTVSGTGANRVGVLGQTSLRNDSADFMNAASSILDQLGVASADRDRVHLRAGVEVRASGDLSIASDWALNADRPGGDAGLLTLRAAGDLNMVAGSISDGFSSAVLTGALNGNQRSWSYRLTAGADLQAADVSAVRDLADAAADSGNLTIGTGRLVRTGAGSIELAAGRDIRFGAASQVTAPGAVYVAGRSPDNQATLNSTLFARQAAKPVFSEAGGRLDITARRDIVAGEATQLINNWLWRSGLPSTLASEPGLYSATNALAWWTQFNRFRQTAGSFGGGDLRATAGRDIVNLQAMLPTNGWATTVNRQRASAQLHVIDGGDMQVRAGRDILGGQYFVAGGGGLIDAGGSISTASSNTLLQAPIFALMNGSWSVQARGSVTTHGVFNPTVAPVQATLEADSRRNPSGYFFTIGDTDSFNITAVAGSATLARFELPQSFGFGNGDVLSMSIAPPRLSIAALSGNVAVNSEALVLFPSTTSAVSLWAGGDLSVSGNLVMADSAPSLWPDFRNPATFADRLVDSRGTGLGSLAIAGTARNVALHAAGFAPATFYAGGSIATPNETASLRLSIPADITAGGDVQGLRLFGQNIGSSDVTSIRAGGSFVAGPQGAVSVAGPGLVQVVAGRDVDLGASAGIVTTANETNANLPAGGASIRVQASARGSLNLAAFDASYLAPEGGSARWQVNRDLLRSIVGDLLGQPNLSDTEARIALASLSDEQQSFVARRILASEFGNKYLAGETPTAAQYTESLRTAFERRKSQLLAAGDAALAAGSALVLPGRETLAGNALAAYLADLRSVGFANLDLGSTATARTATLADIRSGWQAAVAASLGKTVDQIKALEKANPQDPTVLAWRSGLTNFSGERFDRYATQAFEKELASTGAAASLFGRKSLPMRLALFDEGFAAAEWTGAGSFTPQPVWPGADPVFAFDGLLNMTQSAVITRRGGDISLLNAGGPINVGLKESASSSSTPKGVIALGGGNIFGYARDDFQVNTQRVFVVGQGNMDIWSSAGDIDSGRGANTAVAAPPLAARRTTDGVVFEVPATTTGSGLGILEDASGRRSGTIGLYPALGEILALDAFIRAPSVVLGSTVRGADNLQSGSVTGSGAPIAAPAISVAAPPASTDTKTATNTSTAPSQDARPRNSLLTVELLGLGSATEPECSAEDLREGRCKRPAAACTPQQKAAGQCQ